MTTLDIIDKKQASSTHNLPAYDISLLDGLEHDHQELLDLFTKVLNFTKNNEYANVQLSLVEFASVFTNHIHIEDEQLYGYLKILANHKSCLEQKVVADFSAEMKKVSISVFSFLSQSPNIPVNENNAESFIKEFEKIGLLLQDRINREENILYPIYKNSRRVVNIS